jgi:hypothetical protein
MQAKAGIRWQVRGCWQGHLSASYCCCWQLWRNLPALRSLPAMHRSPQPPQRPSQARLQGKRAPDQPAGQLVFGGHIAAASATSPSVLSKDTRLRPRGNSIAVANCCAACVCWLLLTSARARTASRHARPDRRNAERLQRLPGSCCSSTAAG